MIEFTLATKVFVGTSIVLFFIPNALIETSRADVQEFVAIPCLEPTSSENLSSNSATYLPWAICPDFKIPSILDVISFLSTSLN